MVTVNSTSGIINSGRLSRLQHVCGWEIPANASVPWQILDFTTFDMGGDPDGKCDSHVKVTDMSTGEVRR
jgi:hypothetical protein